MEEMNVAALSDQTGRMQLRGESEGAFLISAQGDCTRILNLKESQCALTKTESELNLLFKFNLTQRLLIH